MKHPRWIVGGLIALAALIVAVQSLSAYVTGRLAVGVVAVFVLMGVLGVGLASLVRARRFIEQELAALGAASPGGTLYLERRRKALELRGRNVTPDLDVLADATAAEEAERGYTGKYLVATTVLIGLVGTFGGLMETLARVAPALRGGDLANAGPAGALGLIAGPLAGLHVTFGTSVVAILVTLALALIQGDVTLHHERLLALLQERTRHVLLPELWPAAESAAERTVRAVLDLRTLVGETLTRNAEENAAKVAAVVRVEVQRLVEQVGGAMRTAGQAQATALERTSTTMTDSLRQVATVAAEELRGAAASSQETTKATTAAAREAIEVAAASSRAAMTSAAETIAATVRESDARAREDAARVVRAVEEAMAGAVTGLAAATTRTSEALTEATAGAVAGLADATTRTSEAFTEATAGAVAGLTATTTRTSEAFTEAAAGAVAGLSRPAHDARVGGVHGGDGRRGRGPDGSHVADVGSVHGGDGRRGRGARRGARQPGRAAGRRLAGPDDGRGRSPRRGEDAVSRADRAGAAAGRAERRGRAAGRARREPRTAQRGPRRAGPAGRGR